MIPFIKGQRFGHLVTVSQAPARVLPKGSRMTMWNCLCDCGKETTVWAHDVRRNKTRSCGCGKTHFKHGGSFHPLYDIWSGIIGRCANPNCENYANYGALGVTVCERWKTSLWAFISDIGPRPSLLHSVDRINTFGNYEPSNCRWATNQEQSNNRRYNVRVSRDGVTMTAAQWARHFGITQTSLWQRANKAGGDYERALDFYAQKSSALSCLKAVTGNQ